MVPGVTPTALAKLPRVPASVAGVARAPNCTRTVRATGTASSGTSIAMSHSEVPVTGGPGLVTGVKVSLATCEVPSASYIRTCVLTGSTPSAGRLAASEICEVGTGLKTVWLTRTGARVVRSGSVPPAIAGQPCR